MTQPEIARLENPKAKTANKPRHKEHLLTLRFIFLSLTNAQKINIVKMLNPRIF